MIELNINDMKNTERHSSKGNQLKWNPANTETWYKGISVSGRLTVSGIRQIILVMKV